MTREVESRQEFLGDVCVIESQMLFYVQEDCTHRLAVIEGNRSRMCNADYDYFSRKSGKKSKLDI